MNPIRLYWQMHPDRDDRWYQEMASALGPRRTAQEIDGDFYPQVIQYLICLISKVLKKCYLNIPQY